MPTTIKPHNSDSQFAALTSWPDNYYTGMLLNCTLIQHNIMSVLSGDLNDVVAATKIHINNNGYRIYFTNKSKSNYLVLLFRCQSCFDLIDSFNSMND